MDRKSSKHQLYTWTLLQCTWLCNYHACHDSACNWVCILPLHFPMPATISGTYIETFVVFANRHGSTTSLSHSNLLSSSFSSSPFAVSLIVTTTTLMFHPTLLATGTTLVRQVSLPLQRQCSSATLDSIPSLLLLWNPKTLVATCLSVSLEV